MPTWTWSDPTWREHIGDDPQALFAEALRRAVNIREADGNVAARATMLVDVLNELGAGLGYEVGSLWRGFDNYSE